MRKALEVEESSRAEMRGNSGLIKEGEAEVVNGKWVDAFMPNRAY